jgi:predicted enzyme related to lactoylglutathione lyase
MSNAEIRGRFVWHELMTTDTDAASDFYSHIVPWKTQDSGMPSYKLWVSGKYQAGGLMALPEEEASAPPHWIIYIGTPDVDATVAAAEKLGGKVLKGAADIPNVGRFAVLSDSQGAAFAVFTPLPTSGDGVPPGGAVGDFTWHELATTDPEAAFAFYSELFGWSKGAGHDMGDMGVYQLVSIDGQDVGGIYKVHDNSTPPNWLSYVRVADAAKAADAVKAAGGRVLNGPMEVPGGSWIVQLLDPQGGAFAVLEAPKVAKAAARKSAAKKPAPAAAAAKKAAKKAPATKAPATVAKGAPAKAAAAKKSAAAKKGAAKKSAAKKAAGKKPAGKKPAPKRAIAKKSTTAKRGSAAAKKVAGGKAKAKAKSKGKSKAKTKAKSKK